MNISELKTKIINLDSRPERWIEVQDELKKLEITDFERFPAFLGGAIGCDLSHQACLKGEGALLILEDDVIFEPLALENINTAMSQLPDDFDIFYLGANVKTPAKRYSDNLFRVTEGVHTTHAMLYSEKGRRTIQELYKPGEHPTIDHWLFIEGLRLMNCYVCVPMMAFQRGCYSDIRREWLDYKDEMLKNQELHLK